MSLIQETLEAVLNENHELKIKIENIETKMTTNSTTSPIRKKAHNSRSTELVSNEFNTTNAFANLIEQNLVLTDNVILPNDQQSNGEESTNLTQLSTDNAQNDVISPNEQQSNVEKSNNLTQTSADNSQNDHRTETGNVEVAVNLVDMNNDAKEVNISNNKGKNKIRNYSAVVKTNKAANANNYNVKMINGQSRIVANKHNEEGFIVSNGKKRHNKRNGILTTGTAVSEIKSLRAKSRQFSYHIGRWDMNVDPGTLKIFISGFAQVIELVELNLHI